MNLKESMKLVWNRVFHKRKALPAPIQYTPKEVKAKLRQILNFLCQAEDLKHVCAEKMDIAINDTNIYFYELRRRGNSE